MTDEAPQPRIPADLDAETAMLGAMLLTRDAIVVGADMLLSTDFYDPTHAAVFDSIVDRYRGGLSADPVGVAATLDESGTSTRPERGWKPYLLRLQAETPASANAPHYAATIIDRAERRRLLSVADRLLSAAGDLAVPLDDVVAVGRTGVESTSRTMMARRFPNYVDWSATVDMSEAWVVPGILERQDRVILVAAEGAGKALAVDTPILTTNGWSTMGALDVGDEIYGPDGAPTMVIAATPVLDGRPCYLVTFSDGATIVADAEHLWAAIPYERRQRNGTWEPEIVTTTGLLDRLRARGGHTLNWAIPTAAPIVGTPQPLPVRPYTLGAWLGDGTATSAEITCADPQILDEIRADGYPIVRRPGGRYRYGISDGKRRGRGQKPEDTLNGTLRVSGLLGAKHVPAEYLRAPVADRLALLQGLMDTDGTVSSRGAGTGRGSGSALCEITLTDKRLAADVYELVIGLGIKATVTESDALLRGRVVGRRWRIAYQTALPVFRLRRKADRLTPLRTRRATLRYVASVERVESVPVRCVQVARPDGLYLAGRNLVTTHNSLLLRQWLFMLACGVHWFSLRRMDAQPVLAIDVENSDRQIVRQTDLRLRSVADRVAPGWEHDYMTVIPFASLDLNSRADRLAVESYIAGHRPSVVSLGPLYKIFTSDARHSLEENALRAQRVIDDWRKRYDCAFLIEHHAPKSREGGILEMRGSSAWMGWPEYGMSLEATDEPGEFRLRQNRGMREARNWPSKMTRQGPTGRVWPWGPLGWEDDSPRPAPTVQSQFDQIRNPYRDHDEEIF